MNDVIKERDQFINRIYLVTNDLIKVGKFVAINAKFIALWLVVFFLGNYSLLSIFDIGKSIVLSAVLYGAYWFATKNYKKYIFSLNERLKEMENK